MKQPQLSLSKHSRWPVAVALIYLYIAWGTTYLAIRYGVRDEHLPPALFAGSRVFLSGLVLLGILALRGQRLRLTGGDLVKIIATGVIFFVGGNGLLTFAEQTVPSGVASVLAATTPIWVALLGWLWPRGDRLGPVGWLGLLIGLAGVVVLVVPELTATPVSVGMEQSEPQFWGPLFMLGSTLSWAVGILLLRQAPAHCDHLVAAGYQMAVGGGVLTVIGVFAGEMQALPEEATAGAVVAFVYLLVFGSLLGFVAFNYLLRHVSATLVGTHAYVNPIIAILIGWWLAGEEMSGWLAAGIVLVLLGVFLVRGNLRPSGTNRETLRSDTAHPAPHPERNRIPASR